VVYIFRVLSFKLHRKPERFRSGAKAVILFNPHGILIAGFPYLFEIIVMRILVALFPDFYEPW
jgi:hypothetical protein